MSRFRAICLTISSGCLLPIQVDEISVTAGQLFDHILLGGPHTCIRAVIFCGQKQGVGESHCVF